MAPAGVGGPSAAGGGTEGEGTGGTAADSEPDGILGIEKFSVQLVIQVNNSPIQLVLHLCHRR